MLSKKDNENLRKIVGIAGRIPSVIIDVAKIRLNAKTNIIATVTNGVTKTTVDIIDVFTEEEKVEKLTTTDVGIVKIKELDG